MPFNQKIPHDPRLIRDDFRMPDFTRILFASGKVREYWEEKVGAASRAWLDIERQLLIEGIRPSILIYVPKADMPDTVDWIRKNDLHFTVVATSSQSKSYSSFGSQPAGSGDDVMYRLAICQNMEDVPLWSKAWNEGDDIEIGRLLGYPDCCVTFFDRHWNGLHYRDLTIPAALNSMPDDNDWRSNILGRWAGIRLTSHMPCRFHCKASIKQARAALRVGHEKEINGTGYLQQLMRMPYKYTCLHGIAEIVTPIFKVSASSEATPTLFEYRVQGTVPEMAASGTDFPFENKQRNKVTESKSFKKSIEAISHGDRQQRRSDTLAKDLDEIDEILQSASEKPAPVIQPEQQIRPEKVSPAKQAEKDISSHVATDDRASTAKFEIGDLPDLYKLNGFSSMHAMQQSHQPIIDAVDTPAVVDLGAGNGALLDSIRQRTGGRFLFGCDVNPKAVAFADKFLPNVSVIEKDMFDYTVPDLDDLTVIFMAGRMYERQGTENAQLVDNIVRCAKYVIVYFYGDWIRSTDRMIKKFESLAFDSDKIIVTLDDVATDYTILRKYQIM